MDDATLVFDSTSRLDARPLTTATVVVAVVAVALALYIGYRIGATNVEPK